ncbi:phage tail tape measure protein [Gaoshiqia sediminis]|uniref:Phage tail tape measure protein n=1 Tax=Gaoshiqia sediminis TaxID=2986998 RepID=A0AA42CAP5_9BACT|nr:phage tail tape measure protein [Gaoshiqia sediminis]MCW0484067.1 phage tail tape measure protein [Gaoshiqia sediminis]
MGALNFNADIDIKKFDQKMVILDARISSLVKEFKEGGFVMDSAFGKFGKTLDGIGINLTGLIGPAMALTAAMQFKKWAQDAYEFEREFGMAMREVQTISKAVQEDLKGISDQIVQMAANGPESAINLSKAFYQIVSAGYDGAAGLKLLDISSKAATAGITDTTTAADGLTTVLNAWGISADNAGKVADVMFKTVERGKTTFGQLASTIAQVAPLAASNNIAFEEIFAAIQSITKQGTPTAQAMTQIRSSIINMNKVLGDGWSATMTYQEGLNKVAEMAGGSQNKLKQLIPDVEGVNAVLALTGEKARGAADDLNETAKAAGAMQKAYDTMMEEADNKWAMVHNRWTREIRELGKAIKAGSTSFADFLNSLLADTQLDIINPGSKKLVDEVAASISGITDKEEKLTIILEKINELRNNRVGELSPEASNLEDNLPGWLQRRAEDLNASIGLTGKAWTPGRYTQAELEYLNNQIAITKQAEEGLMKLFAEVSASSTETGNNVGESLETVQQQIDSTGKALEKAKADLDKFRAPGSTKTVNEIEAQEKAVEELQKKLETLTGVKQNSEKEIAGLKGELDKLYKDLETADEKDRKIIAERIVELEKEKKLREEIANQAIKVAENKGIKPINVNAGDIRGTLTGADGKPLFIGKGEVKSIKEVELEFSKLSKRIKSVNDNSKEGLLNTLGTTQEILFNVQGITSEYAEQLGLNEEQAKVLEDGLQAMSGIADIASGNVVQGAAKLIDSALGMFLKTPEKLSDHFVNVQEQVEKILNSVNIAAESLSNLSVDSSMRSIIILKSQLEDLAAEAKTLNDELQGKYYGPRDGDRNGSTVLRNIVQQAADLNVEIEKLSNRLLQGGISDDQRKAIEAVLQSYNGLVAEMNNIIGDVIGVSISDLKNSLADAFFEAEDAAKAWGDTVNDIIANITKKQLTAKLLTAPIDQAVNQLLNDYSDGSLSTDDIKRFQDTMSALYTEVGPAFEEAIAGLKELGIDFGSDSAASGIAGQIGRAITEESASELVGLWNRTALDTRGILESSKAAESSLMNIERNTLDTVLELRTAVTELKAINTNTKTTGSRI